MVLLFKSVLGRVGGISNEVRGEFTTGVGELETSTGMLGVIRSVMWRLKLQLTVRVGVLADSAEELVRGSVISGDVLFAKIKSLVIIEAFTGKDKVRVDCRGRD
jgi:hypothetical protein